MAEPESKSVIYTYKGLEDEVVPDDVTELIIEEGVTTIKKRAFKGKKHLKNIRNFPSSLLIIDDEAFRECTSLVFMPALPSGARFGWWIGNAPNSGAISEE